jgi:hypothetical protein
MFWLTTFILLSKYRNKIGNIRYIFLTTVPLIYFVIPFIPGIFEQLSTIQATNQVTFMVTFSLIFSNSIPIAAIFFGLAFWSIGKTIENTQIRNYMYMAGNGVVLFFISNQAILIIHAPYPPIILPFLAVIGFSSYMILVGIFSSSISFSQDNLLRKKIQRAVETELIFMRNIGNSETEKQLIRKIELVSKEISSDLEKESGVQSHLEGDELHDYITEVINEVMNQEKKDDDEN